MNSTGSHKGNRKDTTYVTCGVSLGGKELISGRLKVVASLHKGAPVLQGEEAVQYGVCQTLAAQLNSVDCNSIELHFAHHSC